MLLADGDSVSDCLLTVGRYKMKMMNLSWEKLLLLWDQLKRFRTLFSDITRGDFDNFIRYITHDNTIWLEICKDREIVGLVTLEELHRVVDFETHILFLDRDLTDKLPITKAGVLWVFDNFPIQRLSVTIPTMYFATIRLVHDIGFKQEGRKRESLLLNGKWIDQYLFGLTRREAYAKCHS